MQNIYLCLKSILGQIIREAVFLASGQKMVHTETVICRHGQYSTLIGWSRKRYKAWEKLDLQRTAVAATRGKGEGETH